jgi:hypothetical protein
MVGHKTVLDSIRATVQTRHRKKLFLQGRLVYPLPSHYNQSWTHLPDYGAYHAALIADSAVPGKWQPGDDVAYILVFEGDLTDGDNPEAHACRMLPSRLSEALPIPIIDRWSKILWEAGFENGLITELATGGDSLKCLSVQLAQSVWAELISGFLKEEKIKKLYSQ